MSHEVETAAYAIEPAWHGLGTVVKHAMSAEEALTLAGLNWEVNLAPVYDVEEFVENGVEVFRYTPQEQWRFTKRMSDRVNLGVVSDQYKVVQNKEALAFVDELLGSGVKFESAGSLFNGKKIWLLARMPDDITIAGDKIIPFVVFTNGHDGKHGVKVALTPTRVVCQNTLQLALSTAVRMWETSHRGDIASKIEEAKLTLQMAENYMEVLPMEAEEMIAANIYEDEVKKLIEALFPYPLTATERVMDGIDTLRQTFWSIYQTKPDLQKFKGTKWGVYNAAADMVSHWEPKRKTSTFKENHFGKIVEGHPVLAKTQKLLRKVQA